MFPGSRSFKSEASEKHIAYILPWIIFLAAIGLYFCHLTSHADVPPEHVLRTVDATVVDDKDYSGDMIVVSFMDEYGNEVICFLDNRERLYHPGNVLRIVYDGGIAECYPAQFIGIQSIEILE